MIEPDALPLAVATGVGATLLVDVWALFLKRAFGVPLAGYCLVGRWFLHMPAGRFRHASIAAAGPRRFECAAGWIVHYATGIVFAIALVALVSESWLARPTLVPALLFGIVTVVFPFFVMQPSLGLGVAASRTPRPAQARLKSLTTHVVFGFGLYLSALALSRLPAA